MENGAKREYSLTRSPWFFGRGERRACVCVFCVPVSSTVNRSGFFYVSLCVRCVSVVCPCVRVSVCPCVACNTYMYAWQSYQMGFDEGKKTVELKLNKGNKDRPT